MEKSTGSKPTGPKKIRMIPAYRFRNQSMGDGTIQEYVNDSLRVIEEDMHKAIEDEKTCCKTEIPTQFEVPGMENARAQRHVYFHMLKALKGAGYIPKIEIDNLQAQDQRVYIHVTWITKEDREEERYMDQYIAANQLKANAHTEAQERELARRRRRR